MGFLGDLWRDIVERCRAQWWTWKGLRGSGEFLCDTCRYSYGSACSRAERPNATKCPDYRSSKIA